MNAGVRNALLILFLPLSAIQAVENPCHSVLSLLFASSADRQYRLFLRENGQVEEAGSGELLSSESSSLLEFRYSISRGVVRPQGRVKLQYLDTCRFRLSVSTSGQPDRSEIVDADRFLASRGMLHFYFDQKRRFFQINRRGTETRMVTEYGPILFRPVAR